MQNQDRKLEALLTLDNSDFEQGLKKSTDKLKMFGQRLSNIGKSLTKYVTAPLMLIGGASLQASRKFEKSMSKINGLVGVSQKQVKEWSDELLGLAPVLGKTPVELADAMYYVTSAGLRGADALSTLKDAAKAATAGLGETKTIADLTTSVINAYGKANINSAQATDILVASIREGKADATQMASALGDILPIAAELGVTFDEVGAATATMTRSGTGVNEAGTQLKNILTSILNPAENARKQLQLMGLSASELRNDLKSKGLIQTMIKLRKVTNEYGEEAMAKVFPNVRALSGILDIMGSNAEANIEIFNAVKHSTGALNKAFASAQQTLDYKWNKALATGQSAMIAIGDTIKVIAIPIIEKLSEVVSGVADWFKTLSATQKKWVAVLGAVVAGLGPMLLIIGKLITVIPSLASAFNGLIYVFKLLKIALLTNPFFAIAAAVIALCAALYMLHKRLTDVSRAQKIINEIEVKAAQSTAQQRVEIEKLMRVAKSEHATKEQKAKAIEKLNAISPKYLGSIKQEAINTGKAQKAIDKYIESLELKAKLQAVNEQLVQVEKERMQAVMTGADAELSFWQELGHGILTASEYISTYGYSVTHAKRVQAAMTNNAKEAEEEYLSTKKRLYDYMESVTGKLNNHTKAFSALPKAVIAYTNAMKKMTDTDTETDKINSEYLKDLEFEKSLLGKTAAQKRALTIARENDVAVGSKEYAQILSITNAIENYNTKTKETVSNYQKVITGLQHEKEALHLTEAEQRAVTLARTNGIKVGSEQYNNILQLVTAYNKEAAAIKKAKEEADKRKDEKEQIKQRLQAIKQALLTEKQLLEQNYQAKQEVVAKAYELGIIENEQKINLLKQFEEQYKQALSNMTKDSKKTQKEMTVWQTTLQNSITAVTQSIGTMFVDFEKGWKSFVSTSLDAISQVINALFIKAIAGMASHEVSTKGIVGLGTAAIGVAALKAFWNSKVQGLATGGDVTQSGVFKVGERGPELVTLPKGAAVTPNNQINNVTNIGGYQRLVATVSGKDIDFVLTNYKNDRNKIT